MYDKAIINGHVYTKEGFKDVNIYINNEKIVHLSKDRLEAKQVIDANHLEVLPGMIDPHVHFELDLGFIKSVDDFYHGSVAAIYGGVTSIVDFLAPVDNEKDLEIAFHSRMAEAKKSMIDYTFHATIKNPQCDLEVFVKKMISLGMYTLKLFTTYSDSNRRTYDKDIIELLKLSRKYHFLLLAHIENDELIILNDHQTHLDLPTSRPTLSETTEALKLANYARETKGNLYMVHLSSGKTLEALIKDYSDILHKNFYVESCPQYFTFNDEKLKTKQGKLYTFAPPLRSEEERVILLKNANHIDTIGTDHCAFMKKDKDKKTLKEMPLGIGGIEFSLSIMRNHIGDQAISKMSDEVARIQGLKSKGSIDIGYDADLVIYQPEQFLIRKHHGRCDYSLYEGLKSFGKPRMVFIRGNLVLDQDLIIHHEGQWIQGGKIND